MNEFEASSFVPTPLRKPLVPSAYRLVDEDMKKFVKDNEDGISYFYKDTKGKITIGYGQMIPNVDAAKDLPLYKFDGTSPLRRVSPEEIEEAWSRLRAFNPGNNSIAQAYDPTDSKNNLMNLRLIKPDMEFLLESTLRQNIFSLQDKLPLFDNYSRNRRKGLADMEFNLGPSFNRKNWKKFYNAVDLNDWIAASKEAHRIGVPEGRNVKTEEALLDGLRKRN